jgi:hypothetical protein
MKKLKEYNVVCVTKLPNQWHLPITGKATLNLQKDELGVPSILSVRFKKMRCELLRTRSGLDGSAVVLVIDNYGEEWELYTDTPSLEKEKKSTPKKIRKNAERCIKNRRK